VSSGLNRFQHIFHPTTSSSDSELEMRCDRIFCPCTFPRCRPT